MKNLTFILVFLAFLFATNAEAGKGKKLKQLQQWRTEADDAFAQNQFQQALDLYMQLLDNQVDADTMMNRNICICANRVGKYELSCGHATIHHVAPGDTLFLFALAQSLDSIGRVEENIAMIERNREDFEVKYGTEAIVEKLAIYYNKNKSDKLCDIYPQIQNSETRSLCFANYFKLVADSQSEVANTKLCKDALKDNPKQESALFFLAKAKYDQAESQYKTTMAEYEKKKNATTYAYLRRDLKHISAIFVESKNYFEQLRSIDPENKSYIKYLININLRLSNDDKAKELQKLL